MKKIIFSILTVGMGFMVACDDHDVLPTVTPTTIFNATTMSHDKDTVSSGGDVIVLTARGGVNDTVEAKKYGISASVKAIDSLTNILYAARYIKPLAVTFDTVDMYKTNLYRWTAVISLSLPPMPAKAKVRASSLFTYGLNLSSQTGNPTGTDSRCFNTK